MQGQSDIGKGIALSVQANRMTAEVLRRMFREFLGGKAQPKGLMSLRKLQNFGAKLDNIEVSEDNIGSFLETARKFDIDYALKRDKTTDPPTYYVFFKANDKKRETFDKAFAEYVSGVSEKERRKNYVKLSEITNAKAKENEWKKENQKQVNPSDTPVINEPEK